MTCRYCNSELTGNQRLYCDTRCQDKWRYHNDPTRREAKRADVLRWRDRHGLPEQQPRMPAAVKPRRQRPCQECGAMFATTLTNRRYCPEHSHSNAARRSKATPLTIVDCPECGAMFQQATHGQKFCTTEHAITHHRRAAKRRRKAAKMAIAHEAYTMREIASRDGHRCGLCHKPVPMRMVVPHPLAPTIDHILPLSKGGDDTKANVQLAHFQCNWRKAAHAHSTDQLRLVG